jgi:diguanylate cyclase (GGDEF)-like protein
MADRIFIADDDPDIIQFVSVNLELEGYEIESAMDGRSALTAITSNPPDLVILDIMMPEMDGLAVLRRMRAHPATANISTIVLTAKALPQDRVRGLELGADDYISKPFELDELIARIKTVLQRSKAMRDLSPLTGLPGNFRITTELERRVESGNPYALAYVDLDNFKAFNDHYGFMRGDGVIKFTAHVLLEAQTEIEDPDAFIGHVGGDDFIAVVDPDLVEDFCKTVIRKFDEGVLDFYDTADVLRGYIEVTDRRGERHAFPLTSISLGVVSTKDRDISNQWEASAVASEMKEYAKRQPGSVYEIDRRAT